jgi:hypothetical protein
MVSSGKNLNSSTPNRWRIGCCKLPMWWDIRHGECIGSLFYWILGSLRKNMDVWKKVGCPKIPQDLNLVFFLAVDTGYSIPVSRCEQTWTNHDNPGPICAMDIESELSKMRIQVLQARLAATLGLSQIDISLWRSDLLGSQPEFGSKYCWVDSESRWK